MTKIIKLEEIQKSTKKIYENCSDIGILQRELEEMLNAIEKNSMDFEKGKISKDLFKYNEERMKKESAKIIKKINEMVDQGISLINKINKEVEFQKIETEEKKKDKIKDTIKEIKKKTRKTKPKKKKAKKKRKTKVAKPVKVVETPVSPAPAAPPVPEQKIEQGS